MNVSATADFIKLHRRATATKLDGAADSIQREIAVEERRAGNYRLFIVRGIKKDLDRIRGMLDH